MLIGQLWKNACILLCNRYSSDTVICQCLKKCPINYQFTSRVYLTWDPAECKRMAGLLDMPLEDKVKNLSRGQLAKLALIVALAHSPELLILDEPTSGLDPIVRRDFLNAIVDLI